MALMGLYPLQYSVTLVLDSVWHANSDSNPNTKTNSKLSPNTNHTSCKLMGSWKEDRGDQVGFIGFL